MKKTVRTGIVLFLLFAFFIGFGSAAPMARAENETTKLTPDEIIAMSNYMNRGGVSFSGKWKARWSGPNVELKSINTVSGESTIINKGKISLYINVEGLWITYLSNGNRTGLEKTAEIKRVRVTGGCEETLVSNKDLPIPGALHYLFMHDKYMYFSILDESTDPISGGFFRANKDGSNITQILNKPAYYPYIVRDKLYYQDDNDGAKLHVCSLDGSGDKVFIDDVCFGYVTDGETFYYSSLNDEKNAGLLKIFHPEKGKTVISDEMPDNPSIAYDGGTTLYYTDVNDSRRLYTYDVKTGEIDNLILKDNVICINFDQGTGNLLLIDCDKNHHFENTLSVSKDGSSVSIA